MQSQTDLLEPRELMEPRRLMDKVLDVYVEREVT